MSRLVSLITLRFPGRYTHEHHTNRLIELAENELIHAAVCLRAYSRLQAMPRSDEPAAVPDGALPSTSDLHELLSAIGDLDAARRRETSLNAERACEQFEGGGLPPRYKRHLELVYARAFVESLRITKRVLRDVAAAERTRVDLVPVIEALDRAQPHLTGVRDSSAHRDERVGGMAKGEPLRTRVVIVECMLGDRLTSTTENGRVGEVSVSDATLQDLVSAVQQTIDRLRWSGPPRQLHF